MTVIRRLCQSQFSLTCKFTRPQTAAFVIFFNFSIFAYLLFVVYITAANICYGEQRLSKCVLAHAAAGSVIAL